MRCLLLIVAHVLLFSGLTFAAPTVFLKDGTKEVGNSVWVENNKVYRSVSNDMYEYSPDEVKLEETLKFNKLGHYQVVAPDERGPAVRNADRTQRRAGRTHSAPLPVKSVAATGSAAPSVAVPPSSASKPVVAAPVTNPVASPPPPIPAPVSAVPKPAPAAQEAPMPAPVPSPPPAAQVGSGFPIVILLITVVVSLLILAAYWIVYERAGQAGWKSLIPIYNMYVLMEISGKPGWWMFLLFIPLVGVVIYFLAMLSLAKKFGRSELFGVGIFLLPMIFLPVLAFGDSQYEG